MVAVRIMPTNNTVIPVTTFGYISEHCRRQPDNSLKLEVDVRRRFNYQAANTLIHDIELLIPFTEDLWQISNFYLQVAPVCLMSDLMMQVRAVYDIGVNPLFRYFLSKDFSLTATGTLVTSDVQKFSPLQLEAIQRAFDLVTQPPPVAGNPCKAVFVDGKPDAVRQTVIEIIHQLSINDLTNKHQYIITSSNESLRGLRLEMKQLLPDFKALKLFFAGHDSDRTVGQQTELLFNAEVALLKDSEKSEASNKRMAHFEKCLSLLQPNSSVSNFEPDVLETVDVFKQHALHRFLKKSRLIFGSLKEFSRSPDIMQHLRLPKLFAAAATPAETQARFPISVCLIADADSLTDPELMAFAKEFSFCRFILTSGWFSPLPAKSEFAMQHSLSDRVRLISSSSDPPLVVDVGGGSGL